DRRPTANARASAATSERSGAGGPAGKDGVRQISGSDACAFELPFRRENGASIGARYSVHGLHAWRSLNRARRVELYANSASIHQPFSSRLIFFLLVFYIGLAPKQLGSRTRSIQKNMRKRQKLHM